MAYRKRSTSTRRRSSTSGGGRRRTSYSSRRRAPARRATSRAPQTIKIVIESPSPQAQYTPGQLPTALGNVAAMTTPKRARF